MRSIRSILTLWYTVALTATVLAFGVTITLLERKANLADLDERLRGQTQLVAGLLEAEYRADPRVTEELSDPLTTLLREGIVERLEPVPGWLIVVDSAGRGVYGSAEVRRLTPGAGELLRGRVFAVAPPPGREEQDFNLELDHVSVRFVALRVRSAGPAIVAVAAGTPTRGVELAPGRLIKSLLVVAPLIVVSALLVGFLLSFRALRPVRGMIDELEDITDGRSLHRRLAPGGPEPDELGRLANALNALLARLETSFGALRRASSILAWVCCWRASSARSPIPVRRRRRWCRWKKRCRKSSAPPSWWTRCSRWRAWTKGAWSCTRSRWTSWRCSTRPSKRRRSWARAPV